MAYAIALAFAGVWAPLAAQARTLGEVQAPCLLKLLQHIEPPIEPATRPDGKPPAQEPNPAKPPPTPSPPPNQEENGKQPPPPPLQPVRIGLVGDDDTTRVARQILDGKQFNGRRVDVVDLKWDALAKGTESSRCRLIYIADALDKEQLTGLVGKGTAILVSARPGFAAAGGDIQLFVQKGHLQMEINGGTLKAKGLRPNPQFLRLSRRGPTR